MNVHRGHSFSAFGAVCLACCAFSASSVFGACCACCACCVCCASCAYSGVPVRPPAFALQNCLAMPSPARAASCHRGMKRPCAVLRSLLPTLWQRRLLRCLPRSLRLFPSMSQFLLLRCCRKRLLPHTCLALLLLRARMLCLQVLGP